MNKPTILDMRPGGQCRTPWCDATRWLGEHHPTHCLSHVGRGVTAHTICGEEVELSVARASADRPGHANVVQLTTVSDAGAVEVDFKPGEARSLAAILLRAADLADGVAR